MTEDMFGIVGSTIAGTYDVEKAVAEGGFGVLYRAYHGAFRAPVALKCLKIPPSLASKDHTELLERFRKEAELMFLLSASLPTVVRPLHADAFTTKDGVLVPFMALEWLEGETLDSLIIRRAKEGRPPLGLKKLVRTLAPIARALERAHKFPSKEGIVSISHCDLKPENIFLADFHGETVAKILDFGIAKMRAATAQIIGRLSQNSELSAFSPCYAAPEQWLPKRFGATGPWTDIWGMALTLVEAAAGRQIMSNDFQAAIGTAIDEKRRPTPRNEGVEVSDAVERVFERALAVDPKNRHPNMAAFWDELEDALAITRSRSSSRRMDSRADSEVPGSVPPADHIDVDALPASRNMQPGKLPAGHDAEDPTFASPPAHGSLALELEDPVPVEPRSGPQKRVALERPSTFPALVVPGPPASARRLDPTPSKRESAIQKTGSGFNMLEPSTDTKGVSIELADFTPPPPGKLRPSTPEVAPDSLRRAGEPPPRLSPDPGRQSQNTPAPRMSRPSPLPEREQESSSDGPPAWHQFRVPIALAILGITVAAVDGGQNQFGPVQLNWIAGGVAGIGIILALWRLFAQ